MRVTHIITRLILGGAQENTVASVLGLRKKAGLEVDLISGPTSGPEGSLEHLFADCPEALSVVPSLIRPVRPWSDWLALRHLTDVLRTRRPDIVHTHSGKAGVLGRLAAARAGVPLVLHTIHGPSFGSFQGALANSLFRFAEARASRVTDHFVVVADAMKRQYLAAGIGRPDQFTRILSGFALEPFLTATNDLELRARLGLEADDIVVGKIARLVERKGHGDLIAIAPALIKTCPRMKFLLVGDGKWRERFTGQVAAMGLEKHFVFAGLVPPAAVAQLVGVMDLLVHLSAREGLPRAIPQAMAAGRPVVAYDCDGSGEVCHDNETGFLVPPGDLAVLMARLVSLAKDPTLRKRLGARGQEEVRNSFSTERMVDDLHHLYLRLYRGLAAATPLAAGS